MKDIDLGTTTACEFGDYLILGISKEWVKFSGDKPLEFEAKIEDKKLVLTASLPGLVRPNISDSGEESDGSN